MSSSNAKQTFDDCPVCYDKYTAQVRKPVKCPYCDFSACVPCNKKYLLDSMLDAHCMGCRRAWNDEFLDLNFTRAYRIGPWKKHREDVLMDREMALLPTRQPRVEALHKLREVQNEIKDVDKELNDLDVEIHKLRVQRDAIIIRKSRMLTRVTRYEHEYRGQTPPAWTLNGEAVPKHERAQFIMKCPDAECRGFLSSAYKCGTCQKYSCKDCLEVLGAQKPETHTCNEERKASVALIIKESKPCPKCGTRISKVDGCDQMWCIDCHTAFSWITGQQVTGVVHNPHYYQYLRQHNGGIVPRNAGDVPCGGLPPYYDVLARCRNLGSAQQRELTNIHRIVAEMTDQRIQRYQGAFHENDNGDLGTSYLIKEISKEDMKNQLAKREVKRNREMAIRAVLEMFATTGTMMFNAISNGHQLTNQSYEEYVREFRALCDYTNDSLSRIGQMKHCVVPCIKSDNWRWTYKGYEPTRKVTRKPKSGSNAAGGGMESESESESEDDEVIEVE